MHDHTNMAEVLASMETNLGYHFNDSALLEEALTHPSISRSHNKSGASFNYERLEFLGDAVLGLVMAELLLRRYPHEKEGALAKRFAALVRGEALAEIARDLSVGEHIRMTAGEASSGGRTNDHNIENALEAIVGAIYLDGGLAAITNFIERHWVNLIENMQDEPPKDPKTSLQEWAQSRGFAIPVYRVVEAKGPVHAPLFTVSVQVSDYPIMQAEGPSKKVAEREAARALVNHLNSENEVS
jgi:ribonuclease-3